MSISYFSEDEQFAFASIIDRMIMYKFMLMHFSDTPDRQEILFDTEDNLYETCYDFDKDIKKVIWPYDVQLIDFEKVKYEWLDEEITCIEIFQFPFFDRLVQRLLLFPNAYLTRFKKDYVYLEQCYDDSDGGDMYSSSTFNNHFIWKSSLNTWHTLILAETCPLRYSDKLINFYRAFHDIVELYHEVFHCYPLREGGQLSCHESLSN